MLACEGKYLWKTDFAANAKAANVTDETMAPERSDEDRELAIEAMNESLEGVDKRTGERAAKAIATRVKASEPVHYDRVCQAIAEAHAIDEVKGFRDKAMAIEVYARQAKNKTAEKQAREIRLRAERRWGELYRRSEKQRAHEAIPASKAPRLCGRTPRPHKRRHRASPHNG